MNRTPLVVKVALVGAILVAYTVFIISLTTARIVKTMEVATYDDHVSIVIQGEEYIYKQE